MYIPWPISTWGMMSVMPPSFPMRMKALGAKVGGLVPGAAAVVAIDAARASSTR